MSKSSSSVYVNRRYSTGKRQTAVRIIYNSFFSSIFPASIIKLTIEVISWPILVQFIVIAIDVGTVMCGLILYVDTAQDRLYYISFIITLALEIFPTCYYGSQVEDHFARLHYAVFSSNWVDQSMNYRKNAIIFAERTQRHPKLLAGNFIPIALTTFLANCKAAYSFFTLIAETGKRN